jgi:SAM-dependent methyltransferase
MVSNNMSFLSEEIMNDRNINYYNRLGVNTLKELAVKGGFADFPDLLMVHSCLTNAGAILEIGAGYGRCIDFLMKNNYQGKIIALEKSPVLYDYLTETYKNVEVVFGDIKTYSMEGKVDVALWMWSGIIDFSLEEQKNCISKVRGFLNEGGKLIIDVPRIGFQTFAQHLDKQRLHISNEFGTLDCYIPSFAEIKEIGEEAGFASAEEVHYKTTTLKERTIYILTA